jgi:hypothetical protein
MASHFEGRKALKGFCFPRSGAKGDTAHVGDARFLQGIGSRPLSPITAKDRP